VLLSGKQCFHFSCDILRVSALSGGLKSDVQSHQSKTAMVLPKKINRIPQGTVCVLISKGAVDNFEDDCIKIGELVNEVNPCARSASASSMSEAHLPWTRSVLPSPPCTALQH